MPTTSQTPCRSCRPSSALAGEEDLLDRFQLFGEYFRRRADGASWTDSAIGWAQSLLDRSDDSEHLLILASLPPDSPTSEVRDYFQRAVRDLGADPPDDLMERLGSARATVELLLDDKVSPSGCASRVHDLLVGPLNHPSSLQEWCDLDSGFVTNATGKVSMKEGADLEAEIRGLARRFLDEDPTRQATRLAEEIRSDAGRGSGR